MTFVLAMAGATAGVLASILMPQHEGLLFSEPTLALVGALTAVTAWRTRIGRLR